MTAAGGVGVGTGEGGESGRIGLHYTPHISDNEYDDDEATVDRLKLFSSSMYNRSFTPFAIFHQTVDTPLYMMNESFIHLHCKEFVNDNEIIVSDTWDTV